MNTKLTLNINEQVISTAKMYAKSNSVSLSKLIENYLLTLTSKTENQSKVSPLVESLTGVITLDKNSDYKKDYSDYLTKKYT